MAGNTIYKPISGQNGVTIVEVAVAAVILSLTFFGVVSIIQKCRDIDFESDLYYQAERLAHSALEENAYHVSQYGALNQQVIAYPDLQIFPEINSNRAITVTKSVTIEEEAVADMGWSGESIPYKRIRATIAWNGGSKSVTASKRISRAE